tara:strand:+ start:562 stop:1812 length:1251 start_codon:yes stop_codon:yes gene_type:complete
MGGACTQSYSQLDSSSGTVAGTEIPAWVAAAGKGLFQEAAAIAQKGYDVFPGEGNRVADLTDAERQGMNILSQGAENYLPYMNRAGEVANTLGQGYQGMSQEELLGDPFQGATRADLLGNYQGSSREELLGDYQGATREELLGDPFSLESAQPYMDIYQSSMDPAVREIEEQTLRAQNEARARASTGGGGFGSRLGIMEATTAGKGAQAAGDLRAGAAREGLGFAAGRYDTDRAARAATENTMRNQFEQDRAARFGAEDVSRGQFEQDRSARFGADSALRGQYDTDRQARFGADTQGRSTYETNEASRIQQMDAYQGMAPLVQDLQRQAAAGLIGAGEAERMLEQAGFDIAYANFLDQKAYPKEQVNFALGALSGTPYNTINRSYTTGSQMTANPSLFGQALAGMGGLYSAYKMSQ